MNKTKKIQIVTFSQIVLIMISLGSILIVNAQETAHVSLTPAVVSTDSLGVGDTFEIEIHIDNVVNLWQWGVSLSWDPDVLTMVGSPVEGPFLKQGGDTMFVASNQNESLGTLPALSSTLTSWTGVSGSGLLATVEFEVVSLGFSDISIYSCELRENVNYEGVIFDSTSSGSTFNATSSTPDPAGNSDPAQIVPLDDEEMDLSLILLAVVVIIGLIIAIVFVLKKK